MIEPGGPADRFVQLWSVPAPAAPHLPGGVRQIYDGDWWPIDPADRPYLFVNFVTSRDGRVSFAEPGAGGAGPISGFSAADRWLMGLLRAGCDAVLVGDGTLRAEPEHIWTSAHIYADDAAAFAALRRHWGLAPHPMQIILSLDGMLDPAAAVFGRPDLTVLVATTTDGAVRASDRLAGCAATLHVMPCGDGRVALELLMRRLRHEHGVRALLCESGPRVYGALLAARLVDDEFLTLSPLMAGEADGRPRPSLVEGTAFAPGRTPRAELLALRRAGEYLFLHSRWHYDALEGS